MSKIIFDTSQIKDIIELYNNGISSTNIANKYKCSFPTIIRLLKINGIKIRARSFNKISLNVSYFDNIDTPEKAYWLGFLFADGCINKRKVTLALKDADPVIQFQKAIGSKHKIGIYHIFDKRTNRIYKRISIQVTSEKFANILIKKFGLGSANYKNYKFPDIPEKLYSHFLRGVFDGDGHISKDKKRAKVVIVISDKMCKFVQKLLKEKFDINPTKLQKLTDNKNYKISILSIANKSIDFLNWIYKDSIPETRLDRKYTRYIEFKKYAESKIGIYNLAKYNGLRISTNPKSIKENERRDKLKTQKLV
jgi:hypothetical protein